MTTPTNPRLPTPTLSSSPTNPVIDYAPHTVPYNASFENALMHTILHPPSTPPARHQPPTSQPIISAADLPIPLTSPLRTHPSPVPGLLLTHEHGYHTGGIGPSAHTVAEFAERLIAERGVRAGDEAGLQRVVAREMEARLEVVRERMREREEAVQRNRGVERELADLKLQRQAEVRVMERMKGKR